MTAPEPLATGAAVVAAAPLLLPGAGVESPPLVDALGVLATGVASVPPDPGGLVVVCVGGLVGGRVFAGVGVGAFVGPGVMVAPRTTSVVKWLFGAA